MEDRLHRYGNLEGFYVAFHKFGERLFSGYIERKDASRYRHPLPLEWRGWQFSLIELDDLKVKIILTYPPLSANGSKAYRLYPKSDWPDMPNDIDGIVRFHGLGEIVWQYDFPNILIDDDEDEAVWGLAVFAGDSIADQHMAATNPSFEEAQRRMMDAYGKLFELEQTLRTFVQQRLEASYGTGWWNQVPPEVRTKVERRETDPTKQWFDDYSPSRFKFADFDDLRLTVARNWQVFKDAIGDRDLFISNMVYLSHARDRIAHVNTLSGDDQQEFLTQAKRLLDIIQPHVVRP